MYHYILRIDWSSTKFKTSTIPSKVTSIGDWAYRGTAVKKVGLECFRDCTKLKDVTLSKGMKRICYGCFYNTGIVNITIPENIN